MPGATLRTCGGDSRRVERRAAGGPPEGLPIVGLLDPYNPDDGKVLSISLFETEADLRQGDATLSSMDPPKSGAMGQRVLVEMYEVAVKIDG